MVTDHGSQRLIENIGPCYFDMPEIFEGVGDELGADPRLAKVATDSAKQARSRTS